MKTTLKTFLHWHKYEWEDTPTYRLYYSDMTNAGTEYALIKEIDVDVEIPDNFDPTPQQIATLMAKKQEVLAEAQLMVNELDEQIQRLLAIEFKPEA